MVFFRSKHGDALEAGLAASAAGVALNLVMATIKIFAGAVGNSYALIADGIESSADIMGSMIVWSGLRFGGQPADENHPYGHGKAESLSGLLVALGLAGAAVVIAVHSVHEIVTPHLSPAWWTLLVLAGVVVIKAWMTTKVMSVADELQSVSLRGDAWHHMSDAITSGAVFIGICVALIGGPKYAAADDVAALLACGFILFNAWGIARAALSEVMDESAPQGKVQQLKEVASAVPGVSRIEKCRVRKSGPGFWMDIHVQVSPDMTVRESHKIGSAVKYALLHAPFAVRDVVVHVEPDETLEPDVEEIK